MRYIVITFVLCTLFSGCYSYECDQFRSVNRMNLNKLSIGMNQQQVMEIMGEGKCEDRFTNAVGKHILLSATNPYRKEILEGKGKIFEVLYYYTDIKSSGSAITDDELTPLVFDNDKLIGWGWNFLDSNVQKYEIRLR